MGRVWEGRTPQAQARTEPVWVLVASHLSLPCMFVKDLNTTCTPESKIRDPEGGRRRVAYSQVQLLLPSKKWIRRFAVRARVCVCVCVCVCVACNTIKRRFLAHYPISLHNSTVKLRVLCLIHRWVKWDSGGKEAFSFFQGNRELRLLWVSQFSWIWPNVLGGFFVFLGIIIPAVSLQPMVAQVGPCSIRGKKEIDEHIIIYTKIVLIDI